MPRFLMGEFRTSLRSSPGRNPHVDGSGSEPTRAAYMGPIRAERHDAGGGNARRAPENRAHTETGTTTGSGERESLAPVV